MRDLNYWDRLSRLKLYSLERRRERFIIIYTWKIITGLVPNLESQISKIQTHINVRRGLLCKIPAIIRDARASIL